MWLCKDVGHARGDTGSPAGACRQLKAVMQLGITTGSEKGLPLRVEIADRNDLFIFHVPDKKGRLGYKGFKMQ